MGKETSFLKKYILYLFKTQITIPLHKKRTQLYLII